MTETIPNCTLLKVRQRGFCLSIALNRPEARNAMSVAMANELALVFSAVHKRRDIAVITLQGEGKHFSAGGDLKDMIDRLAKPKPDEEDALYRVNRRFGDLLTIVDNAPQVVVSITHGAARGGGFGLVCVSDIVIGLADSSFGMPETGFGLPGAQIIPFVCQRLGKAIARRLITTGDTIDGISAQQIGLINYLCKNHEEARTALDKVLEQIRGRSPEAVAQSKRLISSVGKQALSLVLDDGARTVAEMSRTGDGAEGLTAFLEKRKPDWVSRIS